MKVAIARLLSLGLSAAVAAARPSQSLVGCNATWPDTPFVTDGTHMQGASGRSVVYAGVNWPGAADTMLPEGLQYQSIADIVTAIKSLGMNVIRLTYAIEMIDDHLSNATTQTLANTLTNALGAANGTAVLNSILKNNPQFDANTTTRLDVFDAVAAECERQQIWIHLDNHVSKAEWCCSADDGNAWFGDTYFPVYNWQRGLGFMANHTKSWKALASMSLRNELRTPSTPDPIAVTWDNWYQYMVPAARGINGNNSLPLIFLSGLNYDTDDSAITNGQDLGGGQYFNLSQVGCGDKLVFELHNYDQGATCNSITSGLTSAGYGAMDPNNTGFPNHAPVMMTEFGFDMTDGSSGGTYAQCLKNWLPQVPSGPGGWMMWVVAGSYYIRSGIQDYDETWGLFNHDWSAWRNQTVIDTYLKPLISATLQQASLLDELA